jgi:hypothetical protein
MMAAPGRGESWISPYFYYSTHVLLFQVKYRAVRELKGGGGALMVRQSVSTQSVNITILNYQEGDRSFE